MDDVARLAGVSATTVSHVLNGTRRVSLVTRDRVKRAVEELGYRRNPAARVLAGGSSKTIGLSISGLTNPYFGPLVQAIERSVYEAGYVLVLGDSHDEPVREQRIVDSLLDRQVEGLIVAPSPGFEEGAARRIVETQTPLVVVDRVVDMGCDSVASENRRPAKVLTEHLLEHGHTRIAAVVGLRGLPTTEERIGGYRDALRGAGIALDEALLVAGESNTQTAERAVGRLLAGPGRPTALVALNNSMTIGAMRAAKGLGLRVPADLALVAYDDFEWSDLFEPGLTAVAQNVVQMGQEAVSSLFARIEGDRSPFIQRVIPTDFNRRSSCGCI